jgi:DNA topoisomerase IA
MESDMKEIADGRRTKEDVLKSCVESMIEIYKNTFEKRSRIVEIFQQIMNESEDPNQSR